MSGYATGGYIPASMQGDDTVAAYLSAACTIPFPSPPPVHLDDDECVVHQGQDGWVCTRALHVDMACRSSADGTEQPSTPHADTT